MGTPLEAKRPVAPKEPSVVESGERSLAPESTWVTDRPPPQAAATTQHTTAARRSIIPFRTVARLAARRKRLAAYAGQS
jgi:hypothetical protein